MKIGVFNNNNKKLTQVKTKLGNILEKNLIETDDRIINTLKLKNEYIDTKNGIIGRIYNATSNFTEIGISKKKARKKLLQYEQGKISKKAAETYLKQYEYNKKDATELVIDTLVGFASLGLYTKLTGSLSAKFKTMHADLSKIICDQRYYGIRIGTYLTGFSFLLAALTGMTLKPILKTIDNLPSDKKSRKKNKSFIKDTATGFINGAIAPVAGSFKLLGLIPVAATNAITRYATISKDNKSIDDFIMQQTQNLAPKVIALGAIGTGAYFSNKNIEHWQEASTNAIAKIKKMKADESSGISQNFEEIAFNTGVLNNDVCIKIINNNNLTTEEKIKKLEEYNIFLGKYFQTFQESSDFADLKKKFGTFNPTQEQIQARTNDASTYKMFKRRLGINDLASKIKSECPPSRTIKQAQSIVNNTFGNQYEILTIAGVGTIGEAYLAKDKTTGKEVAIKMLKDGIDKDKITQDKQHLLHLAKKAKENNQISAESFKKVKGQVEDLFSNWISEVDFKQEKENALLLAKNNQTFKVTKPIEIKNDIYIMEKAPGIQLNKFEEYLKENDKKLTQEEYKWIIEQYEKIIKEQMVNIPDNNKRIIHGDPHAGNIFVDLDKKEFIFIDTGNVSHNTRKSLLDKHLLEEGISNANTNQLVETMLNDAILPSNLTKEDAKDLLIKDINKEVFNCKNYSSNPTEKIKYIMKSYNILPKDTGANLEKAVRAHKQNILFLKNLPHEEPSKEELEKIIEESIKHPIKTQLKSATKKIKSFLKEKKYKQDIYTMGQSLKRSNTSKEEDTKKLIYSYYQNATASIEAAKTYKNSRK